MSSQTLDAAFIAQQKARLVELRRQLVSVGNAAGSDEQAWQTAAGGEPQDEGDDGERFAQQEVDEAVLKHSEDRVAAVDRALEKIEEGTYGLSDESDEPIPRARLEAVPETIYTVEESEARERNARRGL
ncbi:TraR/DksA family transcriptional regulator [Luteibacter pinisoli]|jgi:DnaK suppressor protein|uniref:TraR/DksA family transcriptional regulator n=1 Tax=Luteibacter pinisoli TaxID=2589080 RepID=A0A4Y5Z534_9GAMM|nr:TraR/DksA family transcriptional regulator [Luteibacter pinisoli]QDE39659.1 TraR/DksA family transcriptional regulator [Luteibacter pinisoli]